MSVGRVTSRRTARREACSTMKMANREQTHRLVTCTASQAQTKVALTACPSDLMLLLLFVVVPVNRRLVRAIEHLIAAQRPEIVPAPFNQAFQFRQSRWEEDSMYPEPRSERKRPL